MTDYKPLNEYLPLKQGLRLRVLVPERTFGFRLNEYLPLKQGLRLNLVKVNVLPKSSMSIFH